MSRRPISLVLVLMAMITYSSCSDKTPDTPAFRFIGSIKIDPLTTFMNTTFGGISGIDMAPDGTFYLISDDDGEINPARFYTATLDYDQDAVRTLNLTNVVVLKTPTGNQFPNYTDYVNNLGGEYADGESIRFNPSTGTLFWTSEGTYIPNAVVAQPFIRQMNKEGNFISEVVTPSKFRYKPTEPTKGLLINATFEGMCLIPDTDELWVALEAPLREDGPRTTFYYTGSAIRIARINWKTGQQIAQYAYVPEKNPLPPVPSTGTSNNGVPEVLAINDKRLLVLERSFSIGYPISKGNNIVLFEVDYSTAFEVNTVESISGGAYRAVKKTEVLNFWKMGLTAPDNIESVCWGKTFANGNRSLVFIVDDNFSGTQQFQVFVFEVSAKYFSGS